MALSNRKFLLIKVIDDLIKRTNFTIVYSPKTHSHIFRCTQCNKFYSTRKNASKLHCPKCGCLRYKD